jgi:hypothetical protein
MPNRYSITLEHIYVSPGHNYFGKPKDGPGLHPTTDVEKVEVRAGRGLVGDRYYSVPAHYEAQITFFAAEVFEALLAQFDRADLQRFSHGATSSHVASTSTSSLVKNSRLSAQIVALLPKTTPSPLSAQSHATLVLG